MSFLPLGRGGTALGSSAARPVTMGAVFGLGGLLLLPVLLATGAPLAASWPNAAVGAYLALVPMFAGYLLFGRALVHVPASTATTLSLLEPAIATILAVIVVGERMPVADWAGLALIAACLLILTAPRARFPAARFRRAAPQVSRRPDNSTDTSRSATAASIRGISVMSSSFSWVQTRTCWMFSEFHQLRDLFVSSSCAQLRRGGGCCGRLR